MSYPNYYLVYGLVNHVFLTLGQPHKLVEPSLVLELSSNNSIGSTNKTSNDTLRHSGLRYSSKALSHTLEVLHRSFSLVKLVSIQALVMAVAILMASYAQLNSATHIKSCNVICDILLYIGPPKSFFQIHMRLLVPRMNRIRRIVILSS